MAIDYQSIAWLCFCLIIAGATGALLLAVALRFIGRECAEVRYQLACLALVVVLVAPLVVHFTDIMPSVLLDVSDPDMKSLLDAGAADPEVADAISVWVAAVWIGGSGFLLLRLATDLLFLHRLRRQLPKSMQVQDAGMVSRILRKIDVEKQPLFYEVDSIQTPVAFGITNPAVLIPEVLKKLPSDEFEAILFHELAHIKRNDYFMNLIQSFLNALFFWSPAVLWISKRIRIERENCCDDMATACCESPEVYCRALFQVEELRGATLPLTVGFHEKRLRDRIRRILRSDRTAPHASRRFLAPFAVLLFSAVQFAAAQLPRSFPVSPVTAVAGNTRTVVTNKVAVVIKKNADRRVEKKESEDHYRLHPTGILKRLFKAERP